jgi:hypothetical protein
MAMVASAAGWAEEVAPVTEVEEVVATCRAPDNGAGPFWAFGAPMVVRVGDLVFTSVMETGEGVPLLCNTRWRLFRRDSKGWEEVLHPSGFREREPCPLVLVGPDRLWISVNPSTEPPGTKYGPCDPHPLAVDVRNPGAAPTKIPPNWPGDPTFTDHSYRGIAADGASGEVILLNIDARTSAQHWAFKGAEGGFTRHGSIEFPIRAAYPQVALRDRAAHVLAVGDIVEPNEAWRAFKREKTGSSWDYVFRRLFHARNPDAARAEFEPPTEVDSVEATGGHITNLDLWIDAAGDAHLLYLKSTGKSPLRDRFFPGEAIVTTLEYATVQGGRTIHHEPLVVGGEAHAETPLYGRFHATADGTLHAVYSVRASDGGAARLEDRLVRLSPTRDASPTRLDLKAPFHTFFTATERGGTAASDVLDLIGPGGGGDPTEIRYARIRLR